MNEQQKAVLAALEQKEPDKTFDAHGITLNLVRPPLRRLLELTRDAPQKTDHIDKIMAYNARLIKNVVEGVQSIEQADMLIEKYPGLMVACARMIRELTTDLDPTLPSTTGSESA